MKQSFSFRNIALFAIVVLMPVCVAYYSINNLIEEQFINSKNTITQELRQQIAHLEHTTTAEYQIKDFFTTLIDDKKLCRQKPEDIKRFIDETDKAYPGAFKWIFLDENLELIRINSSRIVEGVRLWQTALKGGIYGRDRFNENITRPNFEAVLEKATGAYNLLYKMNGEGGVKIEQYFEYANRAYKSKWLNKDCYIIWNTDTIIDNNQKIYKHIGACMLMVFPKNLPEDIWSKRVIVRRERSKEKYKFPIASVNITTSKPFVIDSSLPQDDDFSDGLIKAYNTRTKGIFEYKNYLAGNTAVVDNESELRLISLADISKILKAKHYMQIMLGIACVLLVIISIFLDVYIKKIKFSGVSLRQRIASIFIIAMLLPILSLISVGRTFIIHEENRLKESAIVKMRAGLEALELRYIDTPRIIERELFKKLKLYMGKSPYTIESVKEGMNKACDEGIIKHYIFYFNGKDVVNNWEGSLEKEFSTTLHFIAKRRLSLEKSGEENVAKNQLSMAVEGEINDFLRASTGDWLDFSKSSHLRHFVVMDSHSYFMDVLVNIGNEMGVLFVYLPDSYMEENFAVKEFTTNNIANQESGQSLLVPELSFFANSKGRECYPSNSPIWDLLREVFIRSSELKIEETGEVRVENEDFLYLIKPLSSMNIKLYSPCFLTSLKPIKLRIRDVEITLFTLSSMALIGSLLLSFVLSSSLLVPIKKISDAAQQVGGGNLNVYLPEESKDELGKLSVTFNDMVKGLREREKMEAYVSDSVLEAVKDNGDQSVHVGKHIEATILFSDIRNFTGISEANTPDKIFEVLNEFLGGVEPIIRMNNGRVDKFIGDAVMAIFHHEQPEHHALSAIKAAVKMKEFVAHMNKDREKRGLFPIAIGIGISTGKVLLGDVGSSHRKDLTVIGDEVNLASRLESASKQGKYSKIIFSGQTLKFIEDFVEADKMPFEEIRGKKHAVQIYELIKLNGQDVI